MLGITTVRYPWRIGIKHALTYTLTDNCSLGQWIVPKGTVVKTFQTENFGFVVIPSDCKDVRGFEIPQRIFRY